MPVQAGRFAALIHDATRLRSAVYFVGSRAWSASTPKKWS
jgi:hypothetical protein